MEDRDAPTPLGYGQPRQIAGPSRQVYQYATPNYSYTTSSYSTPSYASYQTSNQVAGTFDVPRSSIDESYASTSTPTEFTTRHRGSFSSIASSNAFTTTTAPSLTGTLPLHIQAAQTHVLPLTPILDPYVLVCECAFAGCEIPFYAENYEDWIAHSLTHFGMAGPPPKSICTICDDERFQFDRTQWRDRMLHIRDHFVRDATVTFQPILRPDFFVIEYMYKIGMLSPQDFDKAMEYTEAPRYTKPPQPRDMKLVPLGYQTREMREKSERESRVPLDQEREDRHRARESKKGKSKHSKDERHTSRSKH